MQARRSRARHRAFRDRGAAWSCWLPGDSMAGRGWRDHDGASAHSVAKALHCGFPLRCVATARPVLVQQARPKASTQMPALPSRLKRPIAVPPWYRSGNSRLKAGVGASHRPQQRRHCAWGFAHSLSQVLSLRHTLRTAQASKRQQTAKFVVGACLASAPPLDEAPAFVHRGRDMCRLFEWARRVTRARSSVAPAQLLG